MLKRWLLAPLNDPIKLDERFNSVADLINFDSEAQNLRSRLAKLPDLERVLNKVFTYSVRTAVKAVYFENVSF